MESDILIFDFQVEESQNDKIWSQESLSCRRVRSGAISGHVTFESLLEITQVEMSREQPDKYLSVEFLGRWANWRINLGPVSVWWHLKPEPGSNPPEVKHSQENRQ